MKKLLLFLLFFSLCFAQYYDIALVRANDSVVVPSLVYDDVSWSYRDNSLENPDLNIRICAGSPSELLNKYVSLCYADGSDGEFIELTHFPAKITSVPPSGCVYVPVEISSFKAWYPSIPYVFISSSTNMSSASRWKLNRLTGWFSGNYSVNRTQYGNQVNVTVINATDDGGNVIVPDVNYLVIGLVRGDLTTMDTEISSVNNTVTLFADSPSANYTVLINGIGPDTPPYVRIITPENGREYMSNSVPFTYIMTDDDGIVNCWYVLDGVTTSMPNCGPAYILSGLHDGLHTLALYANDTTGNTAYDSVQFRIKTAAPKPPRGGGGTGIPYYQPIVPPPPAYMELTIIPQDIFVTVNYAKDGKADFAVTSTITLTDLYCYLRGDFENYTSVTLDKNSIDANETINGTIVVSMPATDILDYDKGKEGVLQCVGNATSTLLASTLANVYLITNKPELELENTTIMIYQGEEMNYTLLVLNKNNVTELQNLSVELTKYRSLFVDKAISQKMAAGESGELRLLIKMPADLDPGAYFIPVNFYEHGRLVGSSLMKLQVLERPIIKPPVCVVPDLSWTVIILFIGLIAAIAVFKWRKRKEMEALGYQEKKKAAAEIEEEGTMKEKLTLLFERNKRPLLYALLTMTIFFIIWLIVVLSLAKCS